MTEGNLTCFQNLNVPPKCDIYFVGTLLLCSLLSSHSYAAQHSTATATVTTFLRFCRATVEVRQMAVSPLSTLSSTERRTRKSPRLGAGAGTALHLHDQSETSTKSLRVDKQLVFDNPKKKKKSLTLPKERFSKDSASNQDGTSSFCSDSKFHEASNHNSSLAQLSSKPTIDKQSRSPSKLKSGSAHQNKLPKKEKDENVKSKEDDLTQDANKKTKGSVAVVNAGTKRTKSPGVRIIGGRIYDSENGKTCHQCRQKTMDFMASCKNVIGKKICTMNFCPKCLLNRYGEKVENAANSEGWKCPRCRGICNCSICMKKQGCAPTGILAHAAKATGFASVTDLLHCQGFTEEQANALNSLSVNSLLESMNSGNMDVKDLIKKLKPLQAKQTTENSPMKEHSTPPMISLLKDENFKNSLKKPSTPAKEPALMNDKSDYKGKSKIKKEMNPNTGVPELGKDSKHTSRILGLSDDVVTTKMKVKKNKKLKAEVELSPKSLSGKGQLGSVIIKDKEKADVPLSSCVSKFSNPKIKDQITPGSKDLKGFNGDDKTVEPQLTKKLMKSAKKQDKPCTNDMCSNAENDMPVESKQAIDAFEKPSKKQKLYHAKAAENRNIVKDSEDEPITAINCSVKVEEKSRSTKKKKCNDNCKEETLMVLPQGKLLQSVACIEVVENDVGPALQFLEFCSAFEQILDLKKGQSESVLRELFRVGRVARRGVYSSVVQFHVKLLSLIQEDIGEQSEISYSGSGRNSWVEVLRKFLVEGYSLKEASTRLSCNSPSDELQKMRQELGASLKGGAEGYERLLPSMKLSILNILCDKSLGTRCLRNCIDSANARLIEFNKEHKEEVMAAKQKAKEAKQKMKDEVARVLLSSMDGPSLTIKEHDELILKVKLEAEKAHAAKVEALKSASKMKMQRCDAVRTNPIVYDENGRIYWRLKGGSDRSVVLIQEAYVDMSGWEHLGSVEHWFFYKEEEENILAKYVSLARTQKAGKQQESEVSPELSHKMMGTEPEYAMEIVLEGATPHTGDGADGS